MDEFDKNFIKNMSPLLITAVVMFFLMVAYETKAEKSEVLYSTTGEAIGIVGYSTLVLCPSLTYIRTDGRMPCFADEPQCASRFIEFI